MGDVKLAAVMGLFLGRAVGPAMLVALVAGSVVGALIIARKGAKEGRKTAIPFGPTWRSAASWGCSRATRSSTGTSTPSSDLKARRQRCR